MFKIGDRVVCVIPFIGIDVHTGKPMRFMPKVGDEYTVADFHPDGTDFIFIQECPYFETFAAYKFRKVSDAHHHSKSTIRNQSVLKRLATLPTIQERVDVKETVNH